MMALFGGRGGQKKTGNQRRKVKEQKKARDAQTAEAKAKARSKRSRPEEDEVVIVKASRAPDNSSADMVKVRAGLKVAHQHGRCWGHQAFAVEKDGPRNPFFGRCF